MHEDELVVDDETVRRLVAAQFPQWSALAVRRLPPVGTDNQLFRLGDDLLVRMPRIPGPAATVAFEHTWLPRLAPHLPVAIPAPVAIGEPGDDFPWPWTVVPWIDGTTPTESSYDPEEWAVELGAFVRACRDVPAMGGPVKTEGRGAPLPALDAWVREWTDRADPAQISRHAVLAVWEDAHLYRGAVGLDEAAYRRARGFALAPAISGWTYYRDSAPETSRAALGTVRRLIASLDA